MSALAKVFPNATFRPWPFSARIVNGGAGVQIGVADYEAAAHAVNTYDASDEALREALEALKDIRGGWRYIRQSHGDLYGVGWDRCEASSSSAIAKIEAALAEGTK